MTSLHQPPHPSQQSQGMQVNTPPAELTRWEYRTAGAGQAHSAFYQQLQPAVQAELQRRLSREPLGKVGQRLRLDVQGYRLEAELVLSRPPASRWIGPATHIEAIYVPPTAEEQQTQSFLAATVDYPNEEYGAWFDSLVGIDYIKRDLLDKLRLMLSKETLINWSRERFGRVIPACATLLNRYPFFILEGDVGSGKTALARSIGHPLALALGRSVQLLVVNTQVRGTGLVGELTHNISHAFSEAEERSQRLGVPVLLLLDEADALAQSRGHAQMHHEDEAGVNTLIQRIDLLREPGREVIVLFATNLGTVLDSAIQRRAAASYHFERPTAEVRKLLFEKFLEGSGVTPQQIEQLVAATMPKAIPGYGDALHPFTHSDIVQRIIPAGVEQAFMNAASEPDLASAILDATTSVMPTPLMSGRTDEL
ncbi:MAG TPA: AAA family ATPase [Chloroflexia bacterium]|nr:AAA family ATPase [Chloroflexia bacterium]